MACKMTLDELLATRSQWWLRAVQGGKVATIKMVIRELGEFTQVGNSSPSLVVTHDGLTLIGLPNGRQFEVKLYERLVAGEWEDFALYVPGPWEDTLMMLAGVARKRELDRLNKTMEEDRQRLIHELWLDSPMTEPQTSNNGKRGQP